MGINFKLKRRHIFGIVVTLLLLVAAAFVIYHLAKKGFKKPFEVCDPTFDLPTDPISWIDGNVVKGTLNKATFCGDLHSAKCYVSNAKGYKQKLTHPEFDSNPKKSLLIEMKIDRKLALSPAKLCCSVYNGENQKCEDLKLISTPPSDIMMNFNDLGGQIAADSLKSIQVTYQNGRPAESFACKVNNQQVDFVSKKRCEITSRTKNETTAKLELSILRNYNDQEVSCSITQSVDGKQVFIKSGKSQALNVKV